MKATKQNGGELSLTQQKVLDTVEALKNQGQTVTRQKVADELKMTKDALFHHLSALDKKGHRIVFPLERPYTRRKKTKKEKHVPNQNQKTIIAEEEKTNKPFEINFRDKKEKEKEKGLFISYRGINLTIVGDVTFSANGDTIEIKLKS